MDSNNVAGIPNPQNQPVNPSVEPNPVEQALAEEPAPAPAPMGAPVKKSGKGMLCGVIIFAILAIGGIGFGVWAMMDGNAQKTNYEKQISDLRTQNNQLLGQITEDGDGNIDINVDTDTDTGEVHIVNPEDYIYIGEWGLKIKKPNDLVYIDYRYHTEISYGEGQYPEWGDHSSIYFYGVTSDTVKSLASDYLRLSYIKKCGLVHISRVPKGEYLPISTANVVRQDDEYDYIVYFNQENINSCTRNGIADVDINAGAVIAEWDGAVLVNEMLSDPSNYSNI